MSIQKPPLTFIDLFAGCGGLSLGLEQAGFHPLLFSEINPSAAETYIINRRHLDVMPVADIHNLTNSDLRLLKIYWKTKGIEDIDLVAGGPPCQGYSGIGHRRTFKLEKKEIPSNRLFAQMIRVIAEIRPRMFLFENVRGLLSARWDAGGEKGEIFRDVRHGFSELQDYEIHWQLIHAKDYGVPQNRPRILMVGIRKDILGFCPRGPAPDQPDAVAVGFLPKPSGIPPTPPELLGDLEDPSFGTLLQTECYPCAARGPFQKLLRSHNGKVAPKGARLTEHEYSSHSEKITAKYRHMIANDGEIPEEFKTKKFAQRVLPRAWGEEGPNITACSLAEDYVHYSQPRSLTVREWARIQTFPDWYQFAGPRTTGGRRRAGDPSKGVWDREVPKYTQIGNAVPVLLAEKIGRHLKSILEGRTKIERAPKP